MTENTEFRVEDTSHAKRQASERGVKAFVEAGYGLSVHWGLYSLLYRGGVWAYYRQRIPYDTYHALMDRFNPERFNAVEWADLMLEADQKFLMITAKHHDGFCMWDTPTTQFKVTNTPFGRDALAELADALHGRGLGLHFYYSLIDWTHPAYRNDWDAYVAYYQGHLRELCTQFGHIDGFLFDGYWPRITFDADGMVYSQPRGAWDLAGTYDLIHELQPDAMIVNNTHVLPLAGEDYQVWELDLPGQATVWFNTTEVGDKPTACWWNLNAGWAYEPSHHAVKSVPELLRTYQAVRQQGAVFMLNVGPRAFGDIHPQEADIMRRLGQEIRELGL